jgi:CBS domain-containing protein
MTLRDVMTAQGEGVAPDASIAEAAAKMQSLDVGALPVVEGPKLMGMVTDRDITIRATAQARDPKQTRVRECLSSELVYAFEDQSIEEAQTLMEQKQIRRLPVLTRDNQLVGIVALSDLATRVGKEPVGRATQAISSSGDQTPQPDASVGVKGDQSGGAPVSVG